MHEVSLLYMQVEAYISASLPMCFKRFNDHKKYKAQYWLHANEEEEVESLHIFQPTQG